MQNHETRINEIVRALERDVDPRQALRLEAELAQLRESRARQDRQRESTTAKIQPRWRVVDPYQ
jgi:hypothetical protein